MAKKQKSFADKAAGSTSSDSVYVKYVKSVQSEDTGRWRFNEQMVRMNKGEQLDAALKRMDEAANLVDIDLSEFVISAEADSDLGQDKVSKSTDDSVSEDAVDAAAEVEKEAVAPDNIESSVDSESDDEDSGSSEEE